MEVKTAVNYFIVEYECPNCKDGVLRPFGRVRFSNPPKHPHKCNNEECNFKKTFLDKKYPYSVIE